MTRARAGAEKNTRAAAGNRSHTNGLRMRMKKVRADEAREEYLFRQTQDRKTLKRINLLLQDIDRNGQRMRIMKRMIMLICILFVLCTAFSGCAGNTKTEDVIPAGEATSTVEPDKIIRMSGDWPGYATIQELVESCDHVIIGEVKNTLPVVRINETTNALHEVRHNYTPSEILIKKVIAGTKKEGDTIVIVQDGGSYTGKTENDEMETITEIMEDIVFLEEGSVYLLFVKGEDNVGNGLPYFYYLPTPQVAYCKIVDEKLITHEDNHLFENGTGLNEAIAMIEESLELAS